VIRFAGHYVLIAKKNQPTLWQDLFTFFTDPQADAGEWQEDHTWQKGHGRLEERRIRTTTLLNPLFERDWPGIGQAFQVRRRTTFPLKCTQQIVYGMTSLTPAQASPARLLALLQTHWHIENRSHYRRDVTDCAKMPLSCGRLVLLWPSLPSMAPSWPSWTGCTFPMSLLRCVAFAPGPKKLYHSSLGLCYGNTGL